MAGVTPEGFVTKRADDLIPDVEAVFINAYGAGIDLAPSSRQGQVVAGFADALAEAWEMGQAVYQNHDITQAEGERIDQEAANLGYRGRNPDEKDENYLAAILGPADTSSNLLDDVQAKIAALDDVTLVYGIVNAENTTDPDTGLPPRSYAVVIEGGQANEIAPILWSSQPTGIKPEGTHTLQTQDNQNYCRDVKYSPLVRVTINIALTVSTFKAHCECGTPTVAEIQAKTVENLNKVQGDCRVGLGQDLLRSQVRAAAGSIPGVNVTGVLLSSGTADPADADVAIAYNEAASFDANNVTVTVS